MMPAAIASKNPFEGLTVRGVRASFENCPIKSAAAGAIFGASLYWGLKSAKNGGPIGAAVKGLIALAVMKRAKNVLLAASDEEPRRRQVAAA